MVYYTFHNDLGSGRAVKVRIHDLYGAGHDCVIKQINPGGTATVNDFHGDHARQVSVRLYATNKVKGNCGNRAPGIHNIMAITGWPKNVL